MEHPQLSILICHLLSRAEQLAVLRAKLDSQNDGRTEILVAGDDGQQTVGSKRNDLLFKARGKYIAFVDDDDDIADDYIPAILKAIETKPDCVGIEGILKSNLGNVIFRHSIQFQGWYTAEDAFYRTPNHLNPVKRGIAQSIGFPARSFGEDQLYSDALRRLLRTEVYIGHPIYFYNKEYEVKK